MRKTELTAKKRLDAKVGKGMKKPAAAKKKAKPSKKPAKASKSKGHVKNNEKDKKSKKEKKKDMDKKSKKEKKNGMEKKTKPASWNAETEYGVAKRLFKGQYAGSKQEFEKCWRQSDTCQRILKSMTTGELKRRRFENWLIQ